jgi:Flp pilus assembly pilin Flp
MSQIVRLRTSEGANIRIVLENCGSGLDYRRRRWALGGDRHWECMDSGERARQTSSNGHKWYTPNRRVRGQTMVEYALIISAIAVVAWGAYSLTGRDIGSMTNGIDSSLTSV